MAYIGVALALLVFVIASGLYLAAASALAQYIILVLAG